MEMPKFSKRVRWYMGIVIIISVFGGILYAIFNWFTVEEIQFIAQNMDIKYNERLIAGNVIFFPADKIRSDLLREYPQLKDVQIQKKLPHTIIIKPILRSIYAILTTNTAMYAIDEEGYVMDIANPQYSFIEIRADVPVVRVGGKVTDEQVLQALRFMKASKNLLPVTKIESMNDGGSIKARSEETEILFTQKQDIEMLMATLQTIITGVRIKGTMPKVIDIRFSKPVIQW